MYCYTTEKVAKEQSPTIYKQATKEFIKTQEQEKGFKAFKCLHKPTRIRMWNTGNWRK